MARRLFPWLVSLSLLLLGSLAAHSLAYLVVEPLPQARAHLLDETGHGYLDALPLVVGGCLALTVVALVALAARARRGAASALPTWLLALLPPIGFAVQEHVERLVGGTGGSAAVAVEPAFLVGLALQLPLALVVLAVARRLTRAAEAIGARTRAAHPRPGAAPPAPGSPDALLRPAGALALCHAGRGPPS